LKSKDQDIKNEEKTGITSDYAAYEGPFIKQTGRRMLNSPTESGFDHVYRRVYGLGSAKQLGHDSGPELDSRSGPWSSLGAGPSPIPGSEVCIDPRPDMKAITFERGCDKANPEPDSGSRPSPVYQALYGSVLTELQSIGRVRDFEVRRRSVEEKLNAGKNFKLEIENVAESEV
jgi:hypothetical protein